MGDSIIDASSSPSDFKRVLERSGIKSKGFRQSPARLFNSIKLRNEVRLVYNERENQLYLSIQCSKILVINTEQDVEWWEVARILGEGEIFPKEGRHTVRGTKRRGEHYLECAVRELANELSNAWKRLGIDPPTADQLVYVPSKNIPDIGDSVTWPGIKTHRHFQLYHLYLKPYLGYHPQEIGESFQFFDRDDAQKRSRNDVRVIVQSRPYDPFCDR